MSKPNIKILREISKSNVNILNEIIIKPNEVDFNGVLPKPIRQFFYDPPPKFDYFQTPAASPGFQETSDAAINLQEYLNGGLPEWDEAISQEASLDENQQVPLQSLDPMNVMPLTNQLGGLQFPLQQPSHTSVPLDDKQQIPLEASMAERDETKSQELPLEGGLLDDSYQPDNQQERWLTHSAILKKIDLEIKQNQRKKILAEEHVCDLGKLIKILEGKKKVLCYYTKAKTGSKI